MLSVGAKMRNSQVCWLYMREICTTSPCPKSCISQQAARCPPQKWHPGFWRREKRNSSCCPCGGWVYPTKLRAFCADPSSGIDVRRSPSFRDGAVIPNRAPSFRDGAVIPNSRWKIVSHHCKTDGEETKVVIKEASVVHPVAHTHTLVTLLHAPEFG